MRLAMQDASGKTVRTDDGAGAGRAESRVLGPAARRGADRKCPQPSFAACFPTPRSVAGPLVPPGKYAAVLTHAGRRGVEGGVVVLPDARSRLSEAERKAHESAISSAYALQEQLGPARQAAQTLADSSRRCGRSSPPRSRSACRRSCRRCSDSWANAAGLASRAQSAIDGYEGPPTAEQSRELERRGTTRWPASER